MSQMKVVGSRNHCKRSRDIQYRNFFVLWIPIYTALYNWPYFNSVVIEKFMINLRRAQNPLS